MKGPANERLVELLISVDAEKLGIRIGTQVTNKLNRDTAGMKNHGSQVYVVCGDKVAPATCGDYQAGMEWATLDMAASNAGLCVRYGLRPKEAEFAVKAAVARLSSEQAPAAVVAKAEPAAIKAPEAAKPDQRKIGRRPAAVAKAIKAPEAAKPVEQRKAS
jgi:hypothetical protein